MYYSDGYAGHINVPKELVVNSRQIAPPLRRFAGMLSFAHCYSLIEMTLLNKHDCNTRVCDMFDLIPTDILKWKDCQC